MRFIKFLILVSFLLMLTTALAMADQKLNQDIKTLKEKIETIEKNNDQKEQIKYTLNVSSDTVKYVGTIATIVLTLIIFLIGYQVIRSYQFEKEMRETRKLMMDEYQKMLDIRIESAKLMSETKSKMGNLEIIVGDVATEFISKKASDLVKKEVTEQTAPVFEEMKTKDEDMNKGIELMKKIEALDLTLTPSVYLERGKIYLDQGNIDKSIENFNKAIELKSDSFDAYFNRGLAYHRTDRFDEAIKDYERAIKINSKIPATYANMGVCYWAKRDDENSIQNFNKAIKLNPKYEFAYLQRGITYQDMGKYDLAINDFRQIETLNQKSPYLPRVLFQIGLSYGKMGNLNSAIEYYLKYFDKEKDVFVALNLAEMYICKKTFPEAEEWANKSYSMSDNDRDRIISKFLLITTLILNNKGYKPELTSIVEKIKATPTFEVGKWSFEELLGCLKDQSIALEKAELVKKLIALLKKEIKPEEIL